MIAVYYTKTGTIIGEVYDTGLRGDVKIKNPCVVHLTAEQVFIQPLLNGIVEQDTIIISQDNIAFKSGRDESNSYAPTRELYNLYNKAFGSGLQLPA